MILERDEALFGALVRAPEHVEIGLLEESGCITVCHLKDGCHDSNVSQDNLESGIHSSELGFALEVVLLELVLLRWYLFFTPIDSGLGVQDLCSTLGSDIVGGCDLSSAFQQLSTLFT